METWELKISKVEMLQRKYMEKNRSIERTVSIEAVLQPRFHYAVNYFSFDAAKFRKNRQTSAKD